MECAFLKVSRDDLCHKKPVNNSQYCAMHKFMMKNSNVKAFYAVVREHILKYKFVIDVMVIN